MKKQLIVYFSLLVLITSIFCTAQGQQTAHKILLNPQMEMQYLLYLPKTYTEDSLQSYPLLLFLHGGGQGGSDIEKVKQNGIPQLIANGKDFPFIVLSPQNPNLLMFWNETALINLLDKIQETYRVDKSRIYIAGISRGGYGAWRMAIQYPDRFAALIAVSGESPSSYAFWLGNMPIWVFHGDADQSIPVSESDAMVNSLKKNGNNVKYTRYENAGHNIGGKAFNTPELFEWMLQQKK